MNLVGSTARSGAESLGDPRDQCPSGDFPTAGVAVENHWSEAGRVVGCPLDHLVFCQVLGGRNQWTPVPGNWAEAGPWAIHTTAGRSKLAAGVRLEPGRGWRRPGFSFCGCGSASHGPPHFVSVVADLFSHPNELLGTVATLRRIRIDGAAK